jgi:hypothetical protein
MMSFGFKPGNSGTGCLRSCELTDYFGVGPELLRDGGPDSTAPVHVVCDHVISDFE